MFRGWTAPSGPRSPHSWGFEITFRRTTLGKTPLDEWSARRRAVYVTIHNTHNSQIYFTSATIETAMPTKERPQTNALDRTATRIGLGRLITFQITLFDGFRRLKS